jgi:hypothetical protein
MLIPVLTRKFRPAALLAGALVAGGASVGLAQQLPMPQSLNPAVKAAPVVPPAQAPKVVPPATRPAAPAAVAPASPTLSGGDNDESATGAEGSDENDTEDPSGDD